MTIEVLNADVRSTLLERLSSAITEGVFKPGDRLVERELCQQFSVSRTSLREALRQLAAEELVEIIPNKGPVVKRMTREELLALWEVRLTIECLAARRFASFGTSEAIASLEQAMDALDRALRSRDKAATKRTKKLFFERFAAGAGNQPLEKILAQLNARLSFLWSSSLAQPGRPAESMAELRTLLQAIRTRNPEAAHAATVLYNEHAKVVALAGLDALEAGRKAA